MVRNGFTFYFSYARIASKLKDKDRLAFYDALINKQFTGVDPVGLPPMAEFAYESQKHSIDKQVIGYERAKNVVLSEIEAPLGSPPGAPLGLSPQQGEEEGEEEEKGQEQVQEKYSNEWTVFWDTYAKKVDLKKCKEKFKKLKPEEVSAILAHVPKYVNSTPDVKYRKNPLTYLNGRGWEDEILQAKPVNDWKPFERHPFSW
jgi:hypothetical protein